MSLPAPFASDDGGRADPANMSPTLGLADAGPLAHALVHHVLSAHGVRTLLVKGPVATAQGLRPSRVSCDVDALLDPRRFEEAQRLIDSLGWHRYHGPESDVAAIGLHATTFTIPGWPATIDLHVHFPGILAPESDAFEHLWARRSEVLLANHLVTCPAPTDHWILIALHALRPLPHHQQLQPEVRHGWRSLPPSQRDEVIASARALGALEPLRATFEALGVDPGLKDTRFATQLRLWEISRSRAGQSGAVWRLRWQRANWRQRPELLWRAFWDISLDSSLSPQEWATATHKERTFGRLRRAGRGLRALPEAVRLGRSLSPGPPEVDEEIPRKAVGDEPLI